MTPRTLVPPALLVTSALLHGACGDAIEPPRVSVVTSLAAPRALLDRAATLSLEVLEGEVTCDPSTGTVTRPADPAKLRTVAATELGRTGCAAGARFCGDVTVARSSAPRVFAATAKDATSTLAEGCATATVEQERVAVAIRMVRFLPPAVCGDGTLQPTEQCEPGGTALCDADCHTKELLLSVGAQANGTQTGGPGDKADPSLLWPAGTGAGGQLYAFYTDRAIAGGNVDVALRVMADDLAPVTTPPALVSGSIFLPNGTTFPPAPSARQQSMPAATFLNGKLFVAFQDDDSPGGNGLDIHLRSMDATLVADQAGAPAGVNGPLGAGEANIQGAPAIAAGPRDRLFVAWEDQGQGKIAGRTLAPPATLGNQNDISSGTGNQSVAVAATANGWVAVWQSGTGIKLRVVNEDGTPQGAEQMVSEGSAPAERPRVASLPDGRFAVAWSAGGDVFVQRYDARGGKVPGDQGAPINDRVTEGTQSAVAIASTPAASGSWVVAWHDATSGHVRARMLGGSSGFLYNPVDGQASEFQASLTESRERRTPAVASGGSGPFVAIAWEDRTAPGAGIVVRRFPLPAE